MKRFLISALVLLTAIPALAQKTVNVNNTTNRLQSTNPWITFPPTGLRLDDTDASHQLTITNGSNQAAARTLTILTTGDTTLTFPTSGTLLTSGSPGLGDVVGPASATDNAIVRFDLTTGKLVQDSAITISDAAANNVSMTAAATTNLTITGGSTGATFVVGQGTNGNVILTPKSSGGSNSDFFQVIPTFTGTQTGNIYGQRIIYTINHAGTTENITWASGALLAELLIEPTNLHTYSNRMTASYSYVNHQGEDVLSLPIASYAVLASRGDGGMGTGRAFDAHMFTEDTGTGVGNVTSFAALNVRPVLTAIGTTVTSLMGLNMEDQTASGGTMGTVYGVKLGTLTAGATLVDGFANWGIYSPGVAPHYFGGPIGVGGGVNASQGLTVSNTVLTGVNQKGIVSNFTATTGSTTSVEAIAATFNTAASGGAYTVTNGVGYRLNSPGIGANTTVTTYRGFRIDNQGASGISNSYAVDILAQSGSAGVNIGLRNAALTVLTEATEATTGAAASLAVTGGIYAAKRIITPTDLINGGGLGWGVTSTATAAGTTVLSGTSTSAQIFTGSTTQSVTLPAANVRGAGYSCVFIVKNRSSGTVTINRAGADTIDGITSYSLLAGNSVTLISDGVSDFTVN